jgi:hypothetical protein
MPILTHSGALSDDGLGLNLTVLFIGCRAPGIFAMAGLEAAF